MSHVKYQLFHTLVCHIIYIFTSTFLQFSILARAEQLKTDDLLEILAGFANPSSCTLTAYKFKDACIRYWKLIQESKNLMSL